MKIGGTPPCAAGTDGPTPARAAEGRAPGAGDGGFAALLGVSVPASSAVPAERTAATAVSDAEPEAEIPAEDLEAVTAPTQTSPQPSSPASAQAPMAQTPPLLNWLLGLAGAATPAASAEPADASALARQAATLPGAAAPAAAPRAATVSPALLATTPGLARIGDADPAANAPAFAAALEAVADAPLAAEPAPAAANPTLTLPQRADAAAFTAVFDARPSVPVAQAAPVIVPLPLDAQSPELAADLAEHIAWQIDDGIGEARIELHPAELGALTVRIETQGDRASVHIVAAEAATRTLLSQALPQLRELLGSSGLQLARSHIEPAARRDDSGRERGGEQGSAATAAQTARRRVTRVVLVDAYV